MGGLLLRRRAMMQTLIRPVSEWEEIPLSSTWTGASGGGYTVSGNNIRVYTNTNQSYANIHQSFTTEYGYEYRWSCDIEDTPNASSAIGFCNASGSLILKTRTWFSQSGHYEKTFGYSLNIATIRLYCTPSTASRGDTTFTNLKVERRRVVENWDNVWTYTDGSPSIKGWTESEAGTGTLEADGYSLVGRTATRSTPVITHGVIEAKLKVISGGGSTKSNRAALRIGDSANCLYVVFRNYTASSKKIQIYNGSTADNGTDIGTYVAGQWYIIRLEINGATGTILLNGDVVAENVDTTTMRAASTMLFGNTAANGATWEFVKYKTLE